MVILQLRRPIELKLSQFCYFYAYVEIHQMRRLVFDNYRRCPVSLIVSRVKRWFSLHKNLSPGPPVFLTVLSHSSNFIPVNILSCCSFLFAGSRGYSWYVGRVVESSPYLRGAETIYQRYSDGKKLSSCPVFVIVFIERLFQRIQSARDNATKNQKERNEYWAKIQKVTESKTH